MRIFAAGHRHFATASAPRFWFFVLSSSFFLCSSYPTAQTALRARILIAEDQRAATDEQLDTLRQGLRSGDAATRRQAVRAIGRLERPDLMRLISPLLTDPNNDVRIETANAIAQLAGGAEGVAAAKSRLATRARADQTPRVRGAMAAALGRLAYTSAADVEEVERVLANMLPTASEAQRAAVINLDEVAGAVEGLESLFRQTAKIARPLPDTVARLRGVANIEGRAQDAAVLARIRRLARAALISGGGVDRKVLDDSMSSPDDEVRRLAMVAARADIEERESAIRRGLSDAEPRVRYEALQTWGRTLQKTSCAPIGAALKDGNVHVVLLAIDLAGNGCPETDRAVYDDVQAMAESVSGDPHGWHRPAHAFVAIGKVKPAAARPLLPRFTSHPVWQVRMYAAHAAGALHAADVLETLARDPHDNVREAALSELAQMKNAAAARLAIDDLSRRDYQLIITAAHTLATAGGGDAPVPALRATLARLVMERRDNSMDARRAVVDALQQLGAPLTPAEKEDALQRLPPAAIAVADVERLRGVTMRFVIQGKGHFDLRLLVDEAPLSALRVATRARAGYYNGLTFHRVVPNFVIQGGSPGANEYVGDAAYMRDEVGLGRHQRGTVGISTRGRDTGDAQIFVNLVDLPRLNHTYTVFAEVVAGMDAVDAILEGDVIERVEVLNDRRSR